MEKQIKAIYYDTLITVSPKTKAYDIWVFSQNLELKGLYKEGVLSLLSKNGFFKKQGKDGVFSYIKVVGNIQENSSLEEIRSFVKDYVWNIFKAFEISLLEYAKEIKVIEIEQLREVFLNQQYNVFNNSFLSNITIENRKALRDTKDTAYLLFKNTGIKIKADGFEYIDYNNFNDCLILKSQIIDRCFEYDDNWKSCDFAKFIKNISNDRKEKKNSFRSVFGYLLHEYNDPTKSQAVILYDEELTDASTPKGGTGKGVIGQAIAAIKKGFIIIDGKRINLNSQFLFQQITEDTRIIFIDDVNKTFNIDMLNSTLTEGVSVEKKFKSIVHVAKDEMPKFLISSNYILPFEGSTRTRRQFVVELSNHYSSKLRNGMEAPLISEHGKNFFGSEWTDVDWNGFYSFMIKCIQFYFANGLQSATSLNIKRNYLIQKIGGELYSFFNAQNFVEGEQLETKLLFEQYKVDYSIGEDYTQRRFSDNLKEFLKYNSYHFEFKKGMIYIK